jgi:hypothetical protein
MLLNEQQVESLRRSAATAHPNAVKAVMRHSSIVLTMDTYGHLLPGQEAAIVAKTPNIMGEAAETDLSVASPKRAAPKSKQPSAQRQAQRACAPDNHPLSTPAIVGRTQSEPTRKQRTRKKAHKTGPSGSVGHPLSFSAHSKKCRAADGSRTHNLQITNQVLCH